jgi:hypothetical protein
VRDFKLNALRVRRALGLARTHETEWLDELAVLSSGAAFDSPFIKNGVQSRAEGHQVHWLMHELTSAEFQTVANLVWIIR